jgi:hypothetical protein
MWRNKCTQQEGLSLRGNLKLIGQGTLASNSLLDGFITVIEVYGLKLGQHY